MQQTILGISMLLICAGYYAVIVDQQHLRYAYSIFPALLAGVGGLLLFFDGVNLHNLYIWDLVVSFLSMWIFLGLAYLYLFKSKRAMMLMMLACMFLSISAVSITLVGLGGK